MKFFYNLLVYSGTALGLFLIILGWVLKMIISDKNKVLGWIVFILVALLGGFCLFARNFFANGAAA